MIECKKINTQKAVAKAVAKFNHKNGYKNPIAWKVINAYLLIVKEAVLDGDEWLFPNGMRMIITREKNKKPLRILNKKIIREKLKKYDVNYTYSINVYGPNMEKYQYNFKASSAFRNEFKELLENSTVNKFITK